MSVTHTGYSDFVRQLSWTQASLELCLDMERNQSDSKFAEVAGSSISYVFDESVFELFIGGFDEPEQRSQSNHVFSDRRKAVGLFNVREWRERSQLSASDENLRISLNRQSSILTTEWLFSESLPGRHDNIIYISKGHLRELRTRWETLIIYYRDLLRSSNLAKGERREVEELLKDRSALALEGGSYESASDIEEYLSQTSRSLRADLSAFWQTLLQGRAPQDGVINRAFWTYAFSRRLAETLASLRVIGPLAQLVRINTSIASRLRLLDYAGEMDSPRELPSSERQPFWLDQISQQIAKREAQGIHIDRSEASRRNDASTLAMVQALANSAVRQGLRKRFILVTADTLLIEVYRSWHCQSALNFEPFVIRPVRHFAPLLNVVNMSHLNPISDAALSEKEDIFPALQAAINPFLLTLNLSPKDLRKPSSGDQEKTGGHDDASRWPQELFALHLHRILDDYQRSNRDEIRGNEAILRSSIADLRLFSTMHFDRLRDADSELRSVSERGRQIERSAIGLGLSRLLVKLEGIRSVKDLIDDTISGDESALTAYIQNMVDDFGLAYLSTQARSFNISQGLRSVVSSDEFSDLSPLRVPLMLNLHFSQGGKTLSVKAEARTMVDQAIAAESNRRGRSRRRRPFEIDLQSGSLALDGGYRLFSLFSCIALRLDKWDLGQRYAAEAYYRAARFASKNLDDIEEARYLSALCMRFQIGAGSVLEAAGFDITQQRFEDARDLLQETVGEGEWDSFVKIRAVSELVALSIFASIWSSADAYVQSRVTPRFSHGSHVHLLHDAWDKTRQLRHAIESKPSNVERPSQDWAELSEQVVVNGFAIVILAFVLGRGNSEARLLDIRSDIPMHRWLDTYDLKLAVKSTPVITEFYRYWFRRVIGRPKEAGPSHFTLELAVDRAAEQLFQLLA